MSKLVLYRKYRPKSFEEVLSQDHVVNILRNAVELGRVSHAYLFAGPRGTGKTSVARILAKEIGCSDIDLIEIDAASSRGIDEVRALREGVHFLPLQGGIKVYIIDEVHMMTKEAFNALLKTLEEPPSHVVFILATTEPEKVPETIVSRCQNFLFRKIPENILKEAIASIAQKEGFIIDDEAAGLIALFSEGSFRDAQGLLDQLLSLGDKNKDKKINGLEARKFLSAPPREMVGDFIDSMIEKDIEKGIAVIQEAVEKNLDMKMFLKLILRDVRSALLLQLAPKNSKKLEQMLGKREFGFIQKLKDLSKPQELEKIFTILLDSYDLRGSSYLPQIPLELALIKIINNN